MYMKRKNSKINEYVGTISIHIQIIVQLLFVEKQFAYNAPIHRKFINLLDTFILFLFSRNSMMKILFVYLFWNFFCIRRKI